MKYISYPETKINLFIIISLFIHLTAAIFSIGSYNPDEHFCILEYVNTKFNLESDPCFRHDRIRSWFQPFIYYLISKTLIIFNITDPFNWSLFYRLFSSVLGWSAIVLIVKNNTSFFSNLITRNIFIISSLFFWFFPFLHARTSSENFGTSFLLIGLSILFCLIQNKFKHKTIFLLLAGMAFGFSFISRYQIGIMILFFLIWSYFYKKFTFKELILILSGIIIIFLIEIFINIWGYNNSNSNINWNFVNDITINEILLNKNSIANITDPYVIYKKTLYELLYRIPLLSYFYYMFFQNSSLLPEAPWWHYLTLTINKFFPPISIVVLLSFFYLWIFLRKNFITWMTLPYIIIHSSIPHKEFRYLFPVLVFFSFCIIIYFRRYKF